MATPVFSASPPLATGRVGATEIFDMDADVKNIYVFWKCLWFKDLDLAGVYLVSFCVFVFSRWFGSGL